jgi:hypothetical protein
MIGGRCCRRGRRLRGVSPLLPLSVHVGVDAPLHRGDLPMDAVCEGSERQRYQCRGYAIMPECERTAGKGAEARAGLVVGTGRARAVGGREARGETQSAEGKDPQTSAHGNQLLLNGKIGEGEGEEAQSRGHASHTRQGG